MNLMALHPDIDWCMWCGVSGGPIDPHHIIHRSQGGPDEVWNILPLCMRCHETVHTHPWVLNDLKILRSLKGSPIWRWDRALEILERKEVGQNGGNR